MNAAPKNTGKEMIIKLAEELPESKIGEAIDFLRYLNQKKEPVLYLDPEEEKELHTLCETEESITLEEAKAIIED